MRRPIGVTVFGGLLVASIVVNAVPSVHSRPPSSIDQAAASDSVVVVVHEGTRLSFDLSSDGRWIVFDLLGQIWLLPAEGGIAVPLTDAVRDTSEDLSPTFSPDGRSVVFSSDRPGGEGLFIVSRDGGLPHRLVSGSTFRIGQRPAWSPDGQRLALIPRQFPEGRRELLMLDLATSAVRPVPVDSLPGKNPLIRDLVWSSDGSRLLFVGPAGRFYEMPEEGGVAQPVYGDLIGLSPALAPDGHRLAFFTAEPPLWVFQLWVTDSSGTPHELTSQEDVTPLGARWTPDGSALVYHADGRLWKVPATGGPPQEIPFTVRLAFRRRQVRIQGPQFAEPGSEVRARGFAGLALSPSGRRIAMLALDTLWVFEVGDHPRSVTSVPPTADGLTWSPDEREVTWSAGAGGAEDLFATVVASGTTRRLTALEGIEIRPAFSPDGEWIAFKHWEFKPLTLEASLCVIPARGSVIDQVELTQRLARENQGRWPYGSSEQLLWSPDSRAVLHDGTLRFLNGDSLDVTFPQEHRNSSFRLWLGDSTVRYVRDELLWQADFAAPFERVGTPSLVSDDAVLYPSAARDGSVLYVSADGLRVRRPDGGVERLGWPLEFRVPVPLPLLLRNVRIVATDEQADSGLHDILLRDGRIKQVGPRGSITTPRGVQVIDAAGRWTMPGLIDVHTHLWDDASLPGALYYGVTTVRDVGSNGIARLVDHDYAIRAGLRQGPRIVAGGIIFQGTGGSSGPGVHGPSDDAARARTMEILRAFGTSYVKVRWFGGWHAITRLVGAAADEGWPVSGHEATQLPLVAAGIAGQEHLGPSATRTEKLIYADVVELWREADMYNVPTIMCFSVVAKAYSDSSLQRRVETDPLVTPFMLWWFRMDLNPRIAEGYALVADIMRRSAGIAYRGGVRIVAGTDAWSVPWALHLELEELVAAGLPPAAALTAATTEAARVLGAEGQIGKVAQGALADLLILEADPLEDIRNTQRIWMVIKGGEVVNRALLQSTAATGGVTGAYREIHSPR